MFTMYFKEYSEKVWGIGCSRISAEWVAQRIKGLSLAKAVKNAFFKFSGKDLPTLADGFLYPLLGIVRIADRLKEEIERRDHVFTGTPVENIRHAGSLIESLTVADHRGSRVVAGEKFISSMPVNDDLSDFTYQGAAFIPFTMTSEQILRLRQIAFKRFYTRPSFILKKLLQLRTWNDLMVAFKSARSLFWLWTKSGLFRDRTTKKKECPGC